MPFQVALNTQLGTLKPITIAIPNPDITDPTATTLTLTATVVSGRINGHRFLWELSTGDPITWTTATNDLSATCNLNGTTTNRVFNLWVDRGRRMQQLFTVNFWGSATENFKSAGAMGTASLSLNDNNSVACSSIVARQNKLGVDNAINPSAIMLTWSLPANLSNLQLIQVEQLVNNVWYVRASLLPTDLQAFYNVQNYDYYRLKSVYLTDYAYSCYYQVAIDASTYNAYIDETFSTASGLMMQAFGVVYYTLITSDAVTDSLKDTFCTAGAMAQSSIPFAATYYTLTTSDMSTTELTDTFKTSGCIGATQASCVYLSGIIIGVIVNN